MYSLDVMIAALDSREFEVTYPLAALEIERLLEDLNGKSSLLGLIVCTGTHYFTLYNRRGWQIRWRNYQKSH